MSQLKTPMDPAARWVFIILGYGFIVSITAVVACTFQKVPISELLSDTVKALIAFFGGVLARTGANMMPPERPDQPSVEQK